MNRETILRAEITRLRAALIIASDELHAAADALLYVDEGLRRSASDQAYEAAERATAVLSDGGDER